MPQALADMALHKRDHGSSRCASGRDSMDDNIEGEWQQCLEKAVPHSKLCFQPAFIHLINDQHGRGIYIVPRIASIRRVQRYVRLS